MKKVANKITKLIPNNNFNFSYHFLKTTFKLQTFLFTYKNFFSTRSRPIFITKSTNMSEKETFNYFVYGSSLDFEAFESWAKQHSHEMIDLTNYELAKLQNYKIVFNINSKFWGGGVASLTAKEGEIVEGISINLPSSLIDIIRQKEGVPNSLYYEKEVNITTNNGEKQALVYIGDPKKVDDSVVPSERFTKALIKGAQSRGLSNEWIEKLQSLIPSNDNNNNKNNNNDNDNKNEKKNDNNNEDVKPHVTEEKLSSVLHSSIPSVFLVIFLNLIVIIMIIIIIIMSYLFYF